MKLFETASTSDQTEMPSSMKNITVSKYEVGIRKLVKMVFTNFYYQGIILKI